MLDIDALTHLIEEPPEHDTQPIDLRDAAQWPRVVILADRRDRGSILSVAAPAHDLEARQMADACLVALRRGLDVRDRSWVVIEGRHAARLPGQFAGLTMLGSRRADLPLTPLFALRFDHGMRPDPSVRQLREEVWRLDGEPEEYDRPVDLDEHGGPPDQGGFLESRRVGDSRVIALHPGYAEVARALMDPLTIDRATWDEVPGASGGLVPRVRFEGRSADQAVFRGACVLDRRVRVPAAPAYGAGRSVSWLVAGPRSGPSWLLPPEDLESVCSYRLVPQLLAHSRLSTTGNDSARRHRRMAAAVLAGFSLNALGALDGWDLLSGAGFGAVVAAVDQVWSAVRSPR